ncbi:Fructose-1,6-bisphosphatase/inositol-1-monophosphatase (plasmid) [Burkholderia sp. AD24]|nr:Fructose-1,6-bisphosphatase/inositol-1-monophosphatase [Burkholderia sp. AD24]
MKFIILTAHHKSPENGARQYIEAMIKPIHDAGKIARRRFFTDVCVSDKVDFGRVVADLNVACEKLIGEGIYSIDLSHAIHSTKVGTAKGTSDWSWIVDPLDGTHNYISAIPLFGVKLTLCHVGEPVDAILHKLYQDEMVHGLRSGPIFQNNTPLKDLQTDKSLESSTIGWI